jgi:hypothetical protein
MLPYGRPAPRRVRSGSHCRWTVALWNWSCQLSGDRKRKWRCSSRTCPVVAWRRPVPCPFAPVTLSCSTLFGRASDRKRYSEDRPGCEREPRYAHRQASLATCVLTLYSLHSRQGDSCLRGTHRRAFLARTVLTVLTAYRFSQNLCSMYSQKPLLRISYSMYSRQLHTVITTLPASVGPPEAAVVGDDWSGLRLLVKQILAGLPASAG